jgi:hypothetical protein
MKCVYSIGAVCPSRGKRRGQGQGMGPGCGGIVGTFCCCCNLFIVLVPTERLLVYIHLGNRRARGALSEVWMYRGHLLLLLL